MSRRVGGRILPYEIGNQKYDNDEFRGQRRRPWMCFRVGSLTPELYTEYFLKFVKTVHSSLIDAGVLLDSETDFLEYTCVETDYDGLFKLLKRGLEKCKEIYEVGPMSIPIVIFLIDQIEGDIVDEIVERFREDVYFFNITCEEALDWIKDDDFDQLEELCNEMANMLKDREGLVESIAFRQPVEEVRYTFGDTPQYIMPAGPTSGCNQSKDLRDLSNPKTNKMHRSEIAAPPGLHPPGLRPTANGPILPPPPGLENKQKSIGSRFDHSDVPGPPGLPPPGLPPPGINPSRPQSRSSHPTLSVRSERSYSRRHVEESHNDDDDEIISIEDVRKALETAYPNGIPRTLGIPSKQNTSRIADYINGSKLYMRFKYPFNAIGHNLDLLYLVNYAVLSSVAKEQSIRSIVSGLFNEDYTAKLKRRFLNDPLIDGRWRENEVEMLYELVLLYFNTSRFSDGFMLTVKDFIPLWEDLTESYKNTNQNSLREFNVTREELNNLRKLMHHVDKWTEKALRNSDSTPSTSSQNHQKNQKDYENERRQRDRDYDYRDERPMLEERRDYSNSRNYERDEDQHNGRRRNDNEMENRRREEPLGFHGGSGPADDEYHSSNLKDECGENVETEQYFEEINTDDKPKQPYHYKEVPDKNYEPPWMKCERMDPPDDFRIMGSIPKMSEYVDPDEPYLRRIKDDGIYKSAADYLDVQFRLLREDLVSPMRDGIDIYRKNGTCRGYRASEALCSDISVYNIDRVDGKQVTEMDGLEMRIVWPNSMDIPKMVGNDTEMKEQTLVMLSNDKFDRDFHLAQVQTSQLGSKGCIHLTIHEETAPFRMDSRYQMAEATSYLPMYKYVLENLRNINRFKPIPFERYLVYGRRKVFRPAFHQAEKDEEELSEEKRLEKVYIDLRSQTAASRYTKGLPIPGGLKNEENFEYAQSKNSQKDLEYMQLREPIFRPQIGVPTGENDTIFIDKKPYSVGNLLSEYHPEYLDESQRQAFCKTFKQEFSIIQGPPGTGKTHLGVQIVKTMLHNRSHWKITEPILIVCYTNSGLDNFLERVLQMIENDEDLSRDEGRPKMIRYGRKSESDYLKRRKVLRYDVHDDYRNIVSESVQKELSRAWSHKRNKMNSLAASSYTLYCSRNDLLSYGVVSQVMHPDHQGEIDRFRMTHVDTKGNILNPDEALACWLLDRDFGLATKAQEKKSKKSKFNGLPDDSDDEKNNFVTIENDDDENDEELDDQQLLDKIFSRMNIAVSAESMQEITSSSTSDEYHTKGCWEICCNSRPEMVLLMGKKAKDGKFQVDEQINLLAQEIKEMVLSSRPLSPVELQDVKFIFSLTRPKRFSLYMTWCDQVRKLVTECLPRQIQEYRLSCIKKDEKQAMFDAEIMKMPMVIGATTTGCARLRPILEEVQPRILICEEAAEVLEAHLLSAMISSVEQVVLIGDHKQLRPNPAVHELGVEYGLNISMFERLVERQMPFTQLCVQHRMNTTITDMIVRPSFYKNVTDALNVLDYPNVEGMATNMFLWAHTEKEESRDGVSWMNLHEVNMTAALVEHLLKQSYSRSDIVVLATYAAQREQMFRMHPYLFNSNIGEDAVQVKTVDSFQGRESKIVIVSLVRSHRGISENTGIGFLSVANRICVALTRAQHGMYIIGNGAYLQNNSQLWKQIVGNLSKNNLISYQLPLKCTAHNNLIEVEYPREFAEKSPEGGCLELCNIRKPCEHICKRPCHPQVLLEHLEMCEYPCSKPCANPMYQHQCKKRCSEECGACMTLVNIRLNCGHTIVTPCSRIPMAKCDQPCTKKLLCGHLCPNTCGVECIALHDCKEEVDVTLSCDHVKSVPCGSFCSGNADLKCIERCKHRMMLCPHQCSHTCGHESGCSVECQEVVEEELKCSHKQNAICSSYKTVDDIRCETHLPQTLEPCQHTQHVRCGEEATTEVCKQACEEKLDACNHYCGNECGICYKTKNHICQSRCQKILACGHACSSKCGEQCPPCKSFCLNMCEHQSCGASEKGFGRECHQMCVLCIRNCSNKCKHRSCSKRCFEECDVKICPEPCSETLKCGHACLGMCGEICPNVCGTCEREKYLSCVSACDTQKVHRLIMIPKCSHVFPVGILDEHIKKQKDSNEILRCPKCQYLISGVLRYVKYTKKLFIESSLKKLRQIIRHDDLAVLENRIFDTVKSVQTETMYGFMGNPSRDQRAVLEDLGRMLTLILHGLNENRGKAVEKWRIAYLLKLAECLKVVLRIFSSSQQFKVASRKSIPPTMDTMIQQLLGILPFPRMIRELQCLIQHFHDTFKYYMHGAILPRMRFQLAKMKILESLTVMLAISTNDKRDLSDSEARDIRITCQKVIEGDMQQNLNANMEHVENTLLRYVPRMGANLTRWSTLDVPDF